ncbi:hypothetical protein K0U07_05675 [bacterium]|nr:hypothetical protein [bacterium]
MPVEISSKELSVKEVLFSLKYYILAGAAFLIGLSYVMAGLHPAKASFAKEYNYFYSMGDAIAKGREVSFERLDAKLVDFEKLRPNFDGYFIENYIDSADYDRAEKIMESVKKRLPVKAEVFSQFSAISLMLEKGDKDAAYKASLNLKRVPKIEKEYPLFYAFTLYRIYLLEDGFALEEKANATKKELLAFIESSENKENIILEKMKKVLQP